MSILSAFSAGIFLGIALFHTLPHAVTEYAPIAHCLATMNSKQNATTSTKRRKRRPTITVTTCVHLIKSGDDPFPLPYLMAFLG